MATGFVSDTLQLPTRKTGKGYKVNSFIFGIWLCHRFGLAMITIIMGVLDHGMSTLLEAKGRPFLIFNLSQGFDFFQTPKLSKAVFVK
jgi:hypothetical protein